MTSLPSRIMNVKFDPATELFTEEQERLLEETNEAFHSYMTADDQCEKFLAYRKYEKASQAFIDSMRDSDE
jgi:hypothetical protein